MVIVENKVEHFHSLHCNEVNFHDMRCLTDTTSFKPLSKQITCGYAVFIPNSNGTEIIKIEEKCESYSRKYSGSFL